jgi:hypothetical protein
MELITGGCAEKLKAINLSLFTGSILNGAHINVKAILRLAYCRYQSMNVNAACQNYEVNDETATK